MLYVILSSFVAIIGTEVEPFWAMTLLFVDTYFDGVWSKFIVNSGGILCFSTLFSVRCANFNSTSLTALDGNSTYPVVSRRLTNPIRWNKHQESLRILKEAAAKSPIADLSLSLYSVYFRRLLDDEVWLVDWVILS